MTFIMNSDEIEALLSLIYRVLGWLLANKFLLLLHLLLLLELGLFQVLSR